MTNSKYVALICPQCKSSFNINQINSYCYQCNHPLIAHYDLSKTRIEDIINFKDQSLWRYKKVLPIIENTNILSLGEGWTKTLTFNKTSKILGLENSIYIKDESTNPTGSFKARGMSVALSKAKELGVKSCCTSTAGNAGSALAAYCALGGMKAKVYMPLLTPRVFEFDTAIMGAEIIKVDGSIRDAGLKMQNDESYTEMMDVSTMKEPFRLEGKKTLGYEIAENFNFKLPDVIFYPTGGGTGLIGIWKAFNEMKQMGWINEINTRLVAVQMSGCDPIVKAFESKQNFSEVCIDPKPTAANGLRVPKAFADRLIMNAIYESNGFAMRIDENQMKEDLNSFAKIEGLFLSPEGAVLISSLRKAIDEKLVSRKDRILLINTGCGYKYIENFW